MDTWDNFLSINGSNVEPPVMPDATTALDGSIEPNSLNANANYGSFSGVLQLGTAAIVIDNVNKRILVNDGTTNRIVIGNI